MGLLERSRLKIKFGGNVPSEKIHAINYATGLLLKKLIGIAVVGKITEPIFVIYASTTNPIVKLLVTITKIIA